MLKLSGAFVKVWEKSLDDIANFIGVTDMLDDESKGEGVLEQGGYFGVE